MKSNWMDKQVSLYSSHSDNVGRSATFKDILLTEFGKDISTIVDLRKLNKDAPDYKLQTKPLKASLQCFTPAALMATKANGKASEICRSGMMQLDFDYNDIKDYDLEELKKCVFNLPFIGFCGLSCSGHGFYALALIAEPEKLGAYADHCFQVLKSYGVRPDESKGKKPENLRYLSYDSNMLIRENPTPLLIKKFKAKSEIKQNIPFNPSLTFNNSSSTLLNSELRKLQLVQSGERWATVQKVAFTVGGLNNHSYLQEINNTIYSNASFVGEEAKYLKCAKDCFNEGLKRPLKPTTQ